jgi:hypothetical protein
MIWYGNFQIIYCWILNPKNNKQIKENKYKKDNLHSVCQSFHQYQQNGQQSLTSCHWIQRKDHDLRDGNLCPGLGQAQKYEPG